MEIYFINWIVLGFLSTFEKYNLLNKKISNFIINLLLIFFIIFIGLRINVGCDWLTYDKIFKGIASMNLFNLKDGGRIEIGYALINKIIFLIGGNIYLSNSLMACLFIIPLTICFRKLNKPFLSFLISYPYLIVIIGMGPIRQAAAMSLIALSAFYINRNFKIFSILNLIALSFHLSSIFTTFIILLSCDDLKENIKKHWKLISIFFLIGLIILYLYTLDNILIKLYSYFFKTRFKYAKSYIIIWFMNIFPYLLLYLNKNIDYKRIQFMKLHKIIFLSLCILPFLSFLDTTLCYRVLINLLPYSVFLMTDLADQNLFISKKFNHLIYLFSSLGLLIGWFSFAKHAYCWLPYRINYISLFNYKILQFFQ